jgi:ATP-dependent helicase/nuclease subunit A
LQLEKAIKPLDWLLPAVLRLPADFVWWTDQGGQRPRRPLLAVATYSRAATDAWRIPPPVDTNRTAALERLADLQPLPAGEPVADDETIEPILRDLTYEYPGLELTTLPARIGVTELKRRWDAMRDPDERPAGRARSPAVAAVPAFVSKSPAETPVSRGTATHRFMQLVDLTRPCNAADLARQRDEMVQQGTLSPQDARQVMIEAAGWFFGTELGRRVRESGGQVEREVAFVSRIPPQRVLPDVRARDDRDVVLIRGMVDVVLSEQAGLEVIDYKTDDVPAKQCQARAEEYRTQIDTYAEALGQIYRQDVKRRWLVFLAAREIVEILP